MAKRANSKRAAVPGRNRSRNGPEFGNGEDRPALSVRTNDKGQVFSHVRQKWLVETPEERVRQAYVVTLHNEYGFNLDQMDEELHVAGRGSARARADIVIWRTAQDKADSKAPLIVVKCKADNITITAADYAQGEAYADADRRYRQYAEELAGKRSSKAKRAENLRKRYDEIQATIDQRQQSSRIWKLSNTCVYGIDANDRMARTSKMNMILHGDGHGGVHHHDGFVNVNGVFEGRFDVFLTNPPFGANVEPTDVLTEDQVTVLWWKPICRI